MLSRRTRRIALFYSIVLAYAGIQVYAVRHAYTGLGLGAAWIAPLSLWVLLMTFFTFLLWRLERNGWHRTATAGAWLGYGWMGTAFLFFWIALALDGVSWAAASTGLGMMQGVNSFATVLALTLACSAYGIFAATQPRIERVLLRSRKIPSGQAPIRIAFISDVHLGALVGRRALGRIVRRLEQLDPDLLLSSGDLVDGQADRLSRLIPMLAGLKPRLGKFAVIGNHECYAGLAHSLEFHQRAGFTVLRGTAATVAPALGIVGVDDPAVLNFGQQGTTDERVALESIPAGQYTILLKHQPVIARDGAPRADLQLSGHVHQGQIFPFNFLVRLVYRQPTGLSTLPGDGQLYVSRGTGTWGPPMRVLAPGEITLIELVGK